MARFARLCQTDSCSGLLPLLSPARHSVVQRPLCRGERQLQLRRGGAQLELPDHFVVVVGAARSAVNGRAELDGAIGGLTALPW